MSFAVPTEQKALVLPAKQAEFVVGPWLVPKPAPGEVLVRAEAVGLNPVDTYVQSTGVFVTEYPSILGWKAAGIVVQLGDGVTSLAVGAKVYACFHCHSRLINSRRVSRQAPPWRHW